MMSDINDRDSGDEGVYRVILMIGIVVVRASI